MRYKDGRFAPHLRFRYFAVNTMMKWQALEAARVFLKQSLSDAACTVEELQELTKTSKKFFVFLTKLYTLAKGELRGST